MYFTNQSENSFTAKFPITKDAFVEEFSQILIETGELDSPDRKFVGEVNNNGFNFKCLYYHKSLARLVIEIKAKLIQNKYELIVETTLNARRTKFSEERIFSQIFLVVLYLIIFSLCLYYFF